MRVIANPRHPADQQGSDYSSAVSKRCVQGNADYRTSGDLHPADHHNGTASCADHNDYDAACARCLIAAGHATDVTTRYLAPTGHLRS